MSRPDKKQRYKAKREARKREQRKRDQISPLKRLALADGTFNCWTVDSPASNG